MSNRTIFRFAVIGLLLFEVAIGVALHFLDDGTLDLAWENLPKSVDWYSYFESHFIISITIAISVIIVALASFIGVLFFYNWGRWLYLICILLNLPLSMITGPIVFYGWEIALWDIVNMANGALVLAMFSTPLSNEFKDLSPQEAARSSYL